MSRNILDWPILVLSLAALGAFGWWWVYTGPQSADKLEQRLGTQVEAALASENLDWASVEMDGQTARLSGEAPTRSARAAALEAVRTAAGDGGPLHGGVTTVTDEQTLADPIAPYVIAADRIEGSLRLSGHVPSRAAKADLIDLASGLDLGEVNADDLLFADGAPTEDWSAAMALGLRELAKLEEGRVELTDTRLLLIGRTGSDTVRAAVLSEMADGLDGFTTDAEIAGFDRWTAIKDGDLMTLEGAVPTETDRETLLALTNRLFPGEVQDSMVVDGEAFANWTDGIQLAMPQFINFQSGRLGFTGENYRVEGEARESVLDFLREDLARLRGNYGVIFQAEPVDAVVPELEGLDFASDAGVSCDLAFDRILSASTIEFRTGSSQISRDSGGVLDKVLVVARKCADARLDIVGHTDDQGARSANITLSRNRAQAVANYLISKGLPTERLSVSGLGPDQPLNTANTPEARRQNRRIEINVVSEEE